LIRKERALKAGRIDGKQQGLWRLRLCLSILYPFTVNISTRRPTTVVRNDHKQGD